MGGGGSFFFFWGGGKSTVEKKNCQVFSHFEKKKKVTKIYSNIAKNAIFCLKFQLWVCCLKYHKIGQKLTRRSDPSVYWDYLRDVRKIACFWGKCFLLKIFRAGCDFCCSKFFARAANFSRGWHLFLLENFCVGCRGPRKPRILELCDTQNYR